MHPAPIPTEVYDTYWRFAAERMSMYYNRLANQTGPWTSDPILQTYRFTNAYRASDRVSQFLIREVQYRHDRSQAPAEVLFRTLLFKIFNKIETWEMIENAVGQISWQGANFDRISELLGMAIRQGTRIYNAAYIMPSPAFGFSRKHDNHLALIRAMMNSGLSGRLSKARTLEEAYNLILGYPGLGPFLAFQYVIDLNYSSLINFDEAEFVVAGPGALDGISKCFVNGSELDAEELIFEMTDRQEQEFCRLGLNFGGLFGRRLQPIDCQNLFCELSKYSRISHPHVQGRSGRTRIKQQYRDKGETAFEPFFPPKWGLKIDPVAAGNRRQLAMF